MLVPADNPAGHPLDLLAQARPAATARGRHRRACPIGAYTRKLLAPHAAELAPHPPHRRPASRTSPASPPRSRSAPPTPGFAYITDARAARRPRDGRSGCPRGRSRRCATRCARCAATAPTRPAREAFINKVPSSSGRARPARSGASASRRGAEPCARGFTALLALCLGIVLAFLAMPIVALFTEVPLRDVPGLLRDPAVQRHADGDACARTRSPTSLILAIGTPAVLLPRDPPLPRPGAGDHADRAAARAAAGGRRDRAAGRVRRRRAVRRPTCRTPGSCCRSPSGRSCSRSFRRLAVLPAPGDRGVRERRPHAARRRAHARRRRRCGRSCGSRSRSPPAGWSPAGCSRSRAGSASSARRSCSPATCAARRRRSRWRSTSSSRRASTSRSRSASCSWSSAPSSCSPTSCWLVAPLELDLTDPLRTFELSCRLTVGAETFALVGPSGAGKTTILRAVAGLRRPGARADRARRRRLARHARAGSTCRPTAARSGSSSRSTRSSRT